MKGLVGVPIGSSPDTKLTSITKSINFGDYIQLYTSISVKTYTIKGCMLLDNTTFNTRMIIL